MTSKNILLISLLVLSCKSRLNKPIIDSDQSTIKTFHRERAYYTGDGKIEIQYNLDSNGLNIVGRNGSPSIIRYQYNDRKQITTITFLDKDSALCSLANWHFYYDSIGRLSSEQFFDENNDKIRHLVKYYYNNKGLVDQKIREGLTYRTTLFKSGMVKYLYDHKDRIIKQQFFNCNGEPACIGDMGVQYITYEYNELGQISNVIDHYSGNIDPDSEAKYQWIHKYNYDSAGILQKCEVKWDFFGELQEYVIYLKYDYAKKLYGFNEDSTKIVALHPYENIKNVVFQEIGSDDYYPYFKRPKM